MIDNFEQLVLDSLKEHKKEWKEFADKQEQKDKEILDTMRKVDKYMVEQDYINKDNDKTFSKIFDEIKLLKDTVDKIVKDYVGKSNLSRILWIGGTCILVFAAGFGAWATYSNMRSEQLKKEMDAREEYALSIPSPEQKKVNLELLEKNKKLEEKLEQLEKLN